MCVVVARRLDRGGWAPMLLGLSLLKMSAIQRIRGSVESLGCVCFKWLLYVIKAGPAQTMTSPYILAAFILDEDFEN